MDPMDIERDREVRETLSRQMRTTLLGTQDAGEQAMQNTLLERWRPEGFPFAVAAEWEYVPGFTNLGRGDLVFASRPGELWRNAHAPTDVLIVEIKHIPNTPGKTARTKRTKGRGKVQVQMFASMDAWHARHRQDRVYGMAFTNEYAPNFAFPVQSRNALDPSRVVRIPDINHIPDIDQLGELSDDELFEMVTALPLTDELCKPVRAQLELVPRSAWAKNYKPSIPMELWGAIRNACLERADFGCECCRSVGRPLVIHQHWEVNDDDRTMTFVQFEAICTLCHDVKHFGRAHANGRGLETLDHLKALAPDADVVDPVDLVEDIEAHFQVWHARNSILEWNIDTTALHALPSVRLWLEADPSRTIGRFGNVCCMSNYNCE